MITTAKPVLITLQCGRLAPKLGQYDLQNGLKNGTIPFKRAEIKYQLPHAPAPFSRQELSRITREEINLPDIKIGLGHIEKAMEGPTSQSAIGLKSLDLSPEITAFFERRFLEDLHQYCHWVVFLPQLEENGFSLSGFELAMAKADQAKVKDFLGGLPTELQQNINATIFINAGNSGLKRSGRESLILTLSWLLGRIMVPQLLAANDLPAEKLGPHSRNLFASYYQREMIRQTQVRLSNPLDEIVAAINGSIDHALLSIPEPEKAVLDQILQARFSGVSLRTIRIAQAISR